MATLADHIEATRKAAADHGFDARGPAEQPRGRSRRRGPRGQRNRCAAIIINPGAFTHYSWAIHDVLAAFDGVKVEVHLSNPNAREAWRHTSVVSPVATGSIVGFGGTGYLLAVEAIARKLAG